MTETAQPGLRRGIGGSGDARVVVGVDLGDGNSFTLTAPLPGGGNPRFHAVYTKAQLEWLETTIREILTRIYGEQSRDRPANDPHRPR